MNEFICEKYKFSAKIKYSTCNKYILQRNPKKSSLQRNNFSQIEQKYLKNSLTKK